jgi:hypothetical protein
MPVKETIVDETFVKMMDEYRQPDKSLGLIEASSKNIVIFAEKMLGLKLYSWQVKFLTNIQASIDGKTAQKEFVAITSRQIGKEQPYSAKVLTPKGYVTMGSLRVGDKVISEDGRPTTVVDIFEQGNKDVYRLTFDDKSTAECGLDHLWKYHTPNNRKHAGNSKWVVGPLKDLLKRDLSNSDKRVSIPVTESVQFEEVPHFISPYVLGVLLGDGSLSKDGSITISSNDTELIERVAQELPPSVVIKKFSPNDYRITGGIVNGRSSFKAELIRLGLLGTDCFTKFIPKEYLIDSVANRVDMLRGLMDTDGSIYGKRVMEYSTSSDRLAEDITFIVQSLGGKATTVDRLTHYVKNGIRVDKGLSHRVFIKHQDINPFSLSRKANKWYPIKYTKERILHKIELVRKENSRCIMVDNPLHTYLTDNCVVTHNSTALAILAIWCCVFNKAPVKKGSFRNTLFGIVSAGDEQAKTLLNEIKKYLYTGDTHMAEYVDAEGKPMFGETFFTSLLSKNQSDSNNKSTVTFAKHIPSVHGDILLAGSKVGSTIRCWPPTDIVLGKTLTVAVIDEAGRLEKITDEFVTEFFLPTTSANGGITIYTSTPWIPAGHFYRMVNPDGTFDDRADVCMFSIDAIKTEGADQYNFVNDKLIAPLIRDGKRDEVQRAFYCRFVKGETAYFDPEDVRKCFSENSAPLTSFKQPCDLGIDFGGQVVSKTVFTISYLDEKATIRRIYSHFYPVGGDNELVNDIALLFKSFNIQRIIVDDCPAGQTFIKSMEDRGWEVHRMVFRADKVKKYGAFRVALKRGYIKSYNDDLLKAEMYALENTPGARQSNIQHAPGYTDDLIDSFLMSTFFFIEDEERLEAFQW